MEKWDILDSSGNTTGKRAIRGKTILASGEYHLVVHIWIISNDGKFLIQQRSKNKRLMPGEWAATGGAAMSGESSIDAARRELSEELGIVKSPESFRFIERIKRRNSLVDIWLIRSDMPITGLKLQKSEVEKAHWVTGECLKNMIESGKFHDYGKYYWSVVFDAADKELQNEFKK